MLRTPELRRPDHRHLAEKNPPPLNLSDGELLAVEVDGQPRPQHLVHRVIRASAVRIHPTAAGPRGPWLAAPPTEATQRRTGFSAPPVSGQPAFGERHLLAVVDLLPGPFDFTGRYDTGTPIGGQKPDRGRRGVVA